MFASTPHTGSTMNIIKFIFKINAALSYLIPPLAARISFYFFRKPQKFPMPAREHEFLKNSESKTLNCGIHIHIWNPKGKEKVLLLHGWNGRGSQMASFAADLIEQNFCVIAMDGPAHGKSRDKVTSPSRFAEALQQVYKELQGFDYIVAHSFGGGASIIALHQGLGLKKIAIIASPSSYWWVVNHYLKFTRMSKWACNSFIDIVDAYVGIKAKDLVLSNYVQSLTIPALIIHDETDKDIPFAEGQALAAAWPNCETIFTKGLGHVRILREPQITKAVAQFFSK